MGQLPLLVAVLWVAWISAGPASAAEPASAQVVGEAFGKAVTEEEFSYHTKTASLFPRSGKPDRTPEEIRKESWQNLIFLHEAERLGITVTHEALEKELSRLCAEKGIPYGTPQYRSWVATTFAEPTVLFEKRVEEGSLCPGHCRVASSIQPPPVQVNASSALDKIML